MNCSDGHTRQTGFTLIELVIAITILGVLTTVVFSGLRTGLRIWTRGNAALEEIQASRASLSLLRAQIQGALPVLVNPDSTSSPTLSFSGDESRMRLVTRASFRDGPDATPRWVELRWEPNGDVGRLTAKEFQMLSPGDVASKEPMWQGTVIEGNAFRFEYLPRRIPGQRVAWKSTWSESNLQMPSAVRLRFAKAGRMNEILLPLEYAENSWSDEWFR